MEEREGFDWLLMRKRLTVGIFTGGRERERERLIYRFLSILYGIEVTMLGEILNAHHI